MVKKVVVTVAASALFFFGIATQGFSGNVGPAEITLQTTGSAKPKPAVFPHKAHQDRMKCGECHHTIAAGKQVPYTEGMEIKKCESCHNKEVLGGKKKGALNLDEFKGAGHGNCLECHKTTAAADPAKKELAVCKTCHSK
jgi:hypothetical protein